VLSLSKSSPLKTCLPILARSLLCAYNMRSHVTNPWRDSPLPSLRNTLTRSYTQTSITSHIANIVDCLYSLIHYDGPIQLLDLPRKLSYTHLETIWQRNQCVFCHNLSRQGEIRLICRTKICSMMQVCFYEII
jgi:hypothetical protein